MNVNCTGLIAAETGVELRPPRDSDRDRTFVLSVGMDLHLFGSREEFTRLRDALTAGLDASA